MKSLSRFHFLSAIIRRELSQSADNRKIAPTHKEAT